ncbi:MAG: phage/plasmid primase, P4 family [SAR324 cluster bacterium]|nr:phage/plasmid primase, P4 family [SAR324 cluster bacterium]
MNKLQKTFNDIVERTRAKSIGTADSFSGLCPAHDDKSASLSITLENDKILLYCHAGCNIDDICLSLGIEKSDLFAPIDEKQINKVPVPQKVEREQIRMKANINFEGKVVFFSSKHNKKVTESVRYSYSDADGKTAYHVIRSDPKDFRPMTPDGFLDHEGVDRLPFRLPELLQGVKESKPILLLEGEKDVDSAMAMGLIATTFVGGAGKWRDEYSEYLNGADVVLIPDNDNPGLKGMTEIATKLQGAASRIRLFELPGMGTRLEKHGKDFSDWAESDGNTAEVLNDLVMDTEDWKFPLEGWLVATDGGFRVNKALLAEQVASDEGGNLICVCQTFWKYSCGVWEREEDPQIKSRIHRKIAIREEALVYLTSALVEDVFKQLSLILLAPPEFKFNREPMILNFTNGTLDLSEGEFSGSHRRELFQNIQFPYEFNRDSHCPNWNLFLESLEFDPDTLSRLQEWAGYCLLPMVQGTLQKSLFFIGEGANGKSVFLETLAAVLDNVSHLELSELFDRFKIAELECKLANICTDVETSKVMDARFKKIVAGEPQSAERKFKEPFEFQPFAKILFSANDFIPTKDRTHGFYRRFDILRFNRIFKLDEQKPDLLQELKKEVPGIFNWALEGLERLSQQNWIMTKSAYMEDCHKEFKRATNPLQLFIEEECILEGNATVVSNVFRSSYKQYCEDNGYKVLSDSNLGKELKRLRINKSRTRTEEGRIFIYEGIQLLSGSVHSVHSMSTV